MGVCSENRLFLSKVHFSKKLREKRKSRQDMWQSRTTSLIAANRPFPEEQC